MNMVSNYTDYRVAILTMLFINLMAFYCNSSSINDRIASKIYFATIDLD